jgi:hypothetical protein
MEDSESSRSTSVHAERYRLEEAFTHALYVPTVIEIDGIVRVTNVYTVQEGWTLSVEYKNLETIPEELYNSDVRQATCYPSSVLLPTYKRSQKVVTGLDYEEFVQQNSVHSESTAAIFDAFFRYDWWLSNLIHFVEGSSKISTALDYFFDLVEKETYYTGTFYVRATHSCLELAQLQKSKGFISPTVLTGTTNYASLGGTLITPETRFELLRKVERNTRPRDTVRDLYNIVYKIHTNDQSDYVISLGGRIIMRAGCGFVFEDMREFNGAMLVVLSMVPGDCCELGVTTEQYYSVVEEGSDLFLDRFLPSADITEAMQMMYESFEEIVPKL